MIRSAALLLGALIFLGLGITVVRADVSYSLSTSVSVGPPRLTFEGFTCANCLVTFLENSTTIGSVYSDVNGYFTKTFESLTEGVHDIGIYATDPDGLVGSTVTFSQSVSLGMVYTRSNIVLPPSVNNFSENTSKGSNLYLYGFGVPNSTIVVVVSGGSSYSMTTNSIGKWQYDLDTSQLAIGTYSVSVKNQMTGGYISELSVGRNINIIEPSSSQSSSNSTGNSINIGPITIPIPNLEKLIVTKNKVLTVFFSIFPLGKDGKYDKDSFELVLKSWVDFWRGNEKDVNKCDLNGDRYCDIYDFSILLYHMT